MADVSDSLEIDVIAAAPVWSREPSAEAIIVRAIRAAAAHSDLDDRAVCEVAVMLTDDAGIRTLNANWRGQDKPTNVLSFPAMPMSAPPQPDDPPRMLGDIAIAYETVVREAQDEDKRFDDHLAHLAVHGFLHLVGYDHETDTEAEDMEGTERTVLASLGIADPYAGEDAA